MEGQTFSEFMDDLYACGGPEKEFTFHGKRYFLQAECRKNSDLIDFVVCEYRKGEVDDALYIFPGKNIRECVEKFEKAKIFAGKTINQVEQEITMLFG